MEDQPPTPSRRWWLGFTILVASVAMGVAAGATLWLFREAHGAPRADRAELRIDAVRTSLAVSGGVVGVAVFVLALRRQWHRESIDFHNRLHQERIAEDARRDATERRITDLYIKAVEQLGSDKAPVRLGGLYALERLAQDNPDHRQAMVNVICAYLRMPYVSNHDPNYTQSESTKELEKSAAEVESKARVVDRNHGSREEMEVRLTAQRILASHLPPVEVSDDPNPVFWYNLRIDLTGATLIDLDFSRRRLDNVIFDYATFTTSGTRFVGCAMFSGAHFTNVARFNHASFIGNATFYRVTFSRTVQFRRATFDGTAVFNHAIFGSEIEYEYTSIEDILLEPADFSGAMFAGNVHFMDTTFNSAIQFGNAKFTRNTYFNDATFNSIALFDSTTFGTPPRPDRARARASTSDPRIWPTGWTSTPGVGDDSGYDELKEEDTT